jgi:hypothetical protein
MAQVLEDVMSHAYEQLEERQRLEAETSLLKTYLVEAHTHEPTHRSILQLLQSVFAPESLGRRATAQVNETDEEQFFTVDVQLGRRTATYFIDASDFRFWVVHSTSKSTSSDQILRRAILNDSHMDSAWLPMELLERVTELGSFRGLGLDYDRREVPDVDFDAPGAPVEFLKMQLWGNPVGQPCR